MPDSHRPALTPAGSKHRRVREFLDATRHPASCGLPYAVALEGTWMIKQAIVAGVSLRAVFVCPALLQAAEVLELASKAMDLGAEGYEVSERVLSRLADRDRPEGIAAL